MGDLRYRLEIEGIEKDVLKVRTLNQALKDLDKSLATNVFGKPKGIQVSDFSNISAATKALNPDLFKQLGKTDGKAFAKAFEDARFEAMNDLARRNITGSSRSMIEFQAALAQSDYAMHQIPGGMQGPIAPASFMRSLQRQQLADEARQLSLRRGSSQAMINMQAAIAQADYEQNNAKGMPVRGRLSALGNLLGAEGSLAKALTAFGAIASGIYVFKQVVDLAVNALRQFVAIAEQGSKLWTQSARFGTSQRKLAGLQNMASLLNIDEGELTQLLARGEFGSVRRGGSALRPSQTSGGGRSLIIDERMLTAARASGATVLQQLSNMEKDRLMAEDDLAIANESMARSSRSLFEVTYNYKLLMTDLNAVFQRGTALLSPFINSITAGFDLITKGVLKLLDEIDKHPMIAAAMAFSGNPLLAIPGLGSLLRSHGEQNFPQVGGGGRIPVSQYEKIGFMFGKSPSFSHDVQKKISSDISKIVTFVQTIVNLMLSKGNGNISDIEGRYWGYNMPAG